MKTDELDGIALDWAVAKCEKPEWLGNQAEVYVLKAGFHPSTDWAQGGQIIERERIEIVPNDMWDAYKEGQHVPNTGATPLVAAMRCYVASKLGDEINVPLFLMGDQTNEI
jgi:hypothetical protein